MSGNALLLFLELLGTFAFALNGALTAAQVARLDIVGVLTLGVITAIGGGIIRDLLIGAVPPEAFTTWLFLTVAAIGALVVFFLGARLAHFKSAITVMDAAGLSLFCVTGATKALSFGLGPAQAALLGMITAVGGGTLRDMLIGRMPRSFQLASMRFPRSSARSSPSSPSAWASIICPPPSSRLAPAS